MLELSQIKQNNIINFVSVMIKTWSFVLSLTILLQSFSFDVSDFSKFSTLANHLSCHFDKGDSFNDFIELHYGSISNSHENEHKEHGELPFKHQHTDTHYQMAFVIFSPIYPIYQLDIVTQRNNFTYKEPCTTLFIHNFFQPPKQV